MRKLWQLLILGCIIVAVPTTALAQSAGFNFVASDAGNFDAGQDSSLDPGELAGVVAQRNWNNLDLTSGSQSSGLVYDNGTGTSVNSSASVTWAGPNTWFAGGQNTFPAGSPNRKLMMGYLDSNDTSAGASMFSIDNIDAALRTPGYDVYVYLSTDNTARRGGGYTLTPQGGAPMVKYGSTLGLPNTFVEDPGTDIDNSLVGNFIKFTGLTGASFTLSGDATLTTPNGFRAPIAAVQIVRGGLLPGDVNGDGQVNMADFTIIRTNLFKSGQTRAQGDLVGNDGLVDFADFRAWKIAAPPGLAASASLSGAIPEPSTGTLFAIGAALAAIARWCTGRTNSRSAL